MQIVLLDTETTGFKENGILQVAAQKIYPDPE